MAFAKDCFYLKFRNFLLQVSYELKICICLDLHTYLLLGSRCFELCIFDWQVGRYSLQNVSFLHVSYSLIFDTYTLGRGT